MNMTPVVTSGNEHGSKKYRYLVLIWVERGGDSPHKMKHTLLKSGLFVFSPGEKRLYGYKHKWDVLHKEELWNMVLCTLSLCHTRSHNLSILRCTEWSRHKNYISWLHITFHSSPVQWFLLTWSRKRSILNCKPINDKLIILHLLYFSIFFCSDRAKFRNVLVFCQPSIIPFIAKSFSACILSDSKDPP